MDATTKNTTKDKDKDKDKATKSRWWGSEEFRARISEEARRSLPGYE